jgi:predicted nuclease of predicted toxin-antitoxin system
VKPPLLADENFPAPAIEALRNAGYDVLALAQHAPQTGDPDVLGLARTTGRWLLTFDSDFGDLIFRDGVPPPPAVLLFRLHPIVVEQVIALAQRCLAAQPQAGFIVVTENDERRRSFVTAGH